MPASLSFKKGDKTTDATGLSDVRVVIYTDNDGNEYTLDTTDNLKLNYKDYADNTKNYEIKNLSGIVSRLIGSNTFKTAVLNDGTNPITTVDGLLTELTIGDNKNKKVYTEQAVDDVFVKTEELATKIAEQAVVDVLVPALVTVGTDNTKKVYTQKAVDDALNLKADASALRDLVLEKGPSAQAVATQLLSTAETKDNLGKAILGVTKEVDGTQQPALETDLAGNKILQDAVASNGTLKAALAKPEAIAAVPALKTDVVTQLLSNANKDKLGTAILGVTKKVDNVDKPALETNLAANPGLQTAVKNALANDQNFGKGARIQANAEDPVFQGSVREVISKPVFETPADDNAPLSWDWT
ncbi:hypothetical protein [Wolbachia pipientis]|uniref:hypothetical protein n=1 Tax=Wolbachia pipientis TaxID=955 RepID=UPI00202E3F54|nr:hypothetical protein [Wolbachia pipientis]MCM1002627.1 hypothetical protein [Wolbachia pipientis]